MIEQGKLDEDVDFFVDADPPDDGIDLVLGLVEDVAVVLAYVFQQSDKSVRHREDPDALPRPVDPEVQGSRTAPLVEGFEQVDRRIEVIGFGDVECKIVSDRRILEHSDDGSLTTMKKSIIEGL